MNKREIKEIRCNLSDESDLLYVNRVVSALICENKEIKCKKVSNYNLMEDSESELILQNFKESLKGNVGKNLIELPFGGERQDLFYKVLQDKFRDEQITDEFIAFIAENTPCTEYALFAANCTYLVHENCEYNFIITAMCPVEKRIDGLLYDNFEKIFYTKTGFDNIVKKPTQGFIFPTFSDRSSDVNSILYTTRKPEKIITEDLFGCNFTGDSNSQKAAFYAILDDVFSGLRSSDIIEVNDYIKNLIDIHNETKPLMIGISEMQTMLSNICIWFDIEKIFHVLSEVYDDVFGKDNKFRAECLVDKQLTLKSEHFSLKMDNDCAGILKFKTIEGVEYLLVPCSGEIVVNDITLS